MTRPPDQALILGIESSCDETAASVVRGGRAVLSNIVASQNALHEKFGGVVPEIASRAHIERITPVIDQALDQAGVQFTDLDAIAVGNRPGLIGSLLVGVAAAKALAWALGKPLIGVDHVQAHLYAAGLDAPPIAYPALGLVVSGGHTSLYAVEDALRMRLLGRTIDDAVGEAYDKVASILNLGFPGGPLVDRLAQRGNAKAVPLPRTLLEPQSLNFSFSGLKTAVLYAVRGFPKPGGDREAWKRQPLTLTEAQQADLCAAFQQAVVDTLSIKLDRALHAMRQTDSAPRSLLIGGGVSANSLLRAGATAFAQRRKLDLKLPAPPYCLDNAAMIAGLAHQRLLEKQFDDLDLPAIATTAF